MIIKKTEVGDRGPLIDELKKLLGKKFHVEEECSIKHQEHFIKYKGRDQPDILIFYRDLIKIKEKTIEYEDKRAVVAVIDTKKAGEDITKRSHFGQLIQYLFDIKAKHGFLTNLKDVASHHLEIEKLRRKTSFSDIKDLAFWIVECITEHYGHLPIPISIERIINTLDNSMENLIFYVKSESVDVWEEILKIRDLEDEMLYKTEEEKIAARYRGAAFIALSQLLFYIVLRASRVIHEQNFDPILRRLIISNGVPNQIQSLLNDVKEDINYKAIYDYEVFPHLPDSANETLKKIIENLEGLSNELVIQHDLIGLLFQRLIPFELRKKLAAYYTKPLAAELLARLTFETGDEIVLDPACGSGTLLVHSYLQKRRLKGLNAKHHVLISEIMGSDISVFASILASVNLAIQDPGKWTNKVNIFNENAFNLPKARIERFLPKSVLEIIKKLKAQTSDGTEIVERPGLISDVVIMNPPFTRGSRLTPQERDILLNVSKIYNLKHGWRDWNLYSSFILLAPEFLKLEEKGKISLVLPYAAISTKYMEKVWEKLFKQTKLGVKYIINASLTEISFSDSSEQEMLMVLERGYLKPCKLIQLTQKLENYDIEELSKIIINLEESGNFPTDSTYFEGHQIVQNEFKAMKSREWSFSPPGILELLQRDFVSSKELDFVVIGGGNSSKPVDYFWIPNKYWELDYEADTEIIFKQTLETHKLIQNINLLKNTFPNKQIYDFYGNIPNSFSEDLKKELEIISENIWILFSKISQKKVESMLSKIPETITIPKKYLVKSLPRKLRILENQPPIFNDNYPYIFFLNYTELCKDTSEKYFIWGELLRGTLASWVCAPPRSASLFFPVKIRLNSMKTIALYSPDLLDSARVAGVIFIPANSSLQTKESMEVLFAYLTSSIFLYDYIQKGRVVSGALRQLFSTDLHSLMKFPNIRMISEEDKEIILKESKEHNSKVTLKNRPIFSSMISNALNNRESSKLRRLDEAIFKALNIPSAILDTLYKEILKELNPDRIK